MAKRGRPKKLTDDDQTTHVRLKKDLADMIRVVSRLKGKQVAQLLDPILRPAITGMYAALGPAIAAIEKAESPKAGGSDLKAKRG